ncbi:MAG: hypothetical protein HC888_11360 [Candidatus Competibacteraceae bacterium]|nr:hypothetical protein [Candidatus Competibacteraceae bacterium]
MNKKLASQILLLSAVCFLFAGVAFDRPSFLSPHYFREKQRPTPLNSYILSAASRYPEDGSYAAITGSEVVDGLWVPVMMFFFGIVF